jgi:hypothetical protein
MVFMYVLSTPAAGTTFDWHNHDFCFCPSTDARSRADPLSLRMIADRLHSRFLATVVVEKPANTSRNAGSPSWYSLQADDGYYRITTGLVGFNQTCQNDLKWASLNKRVV